MGPFLPIWGRGGRGKGAERWTAVDKVAPDGNTPG